MHHSARPQRRILLALSDLLPPLQSNGFLVKRLRILMNIVVGALATNGPFIEIFKIANKRN